ncbi:hypothetical protein NDU88_000895 [Pleurodeles waltl]|uniref:Uncharacterized protein n=1 Tax=Pleurodeles waltl TaxID=8319 RepID=A0AAV7VUV3_PLEWA|nr:hypothetical protein NDU88_000895 [Pleurodeles waltl]
MAAMSAVMPLAEDVAGPLAVLAAVSVAVVLAADSVASVLVTDSVASVQAAGSVASVLAADSVDTVLAAVFVAAGSLTAVLVAASLTAVLVKGSVSAVLVKGSVSAVLAAVSVAAVQVAVLSIVQVGGDVDLPLIFWPFPTLDGGAAVFPLSTFVLPEPLVAGVFAFSLRDVGNFFCFGGGGMSLPSLLGTLAALLLGALQNPTIAGTTVPGDGVAELLGWDLERRALGDGRG